MDTPKTLSRDEAIGLVRRYKQAISHRFSVQPKVMLFGSYAKGTANERSDIDIYVDSGLRGLKFFGLLEDVTNALNMRVDLIDASQVEAESKVLSEINTTGILIYGKQR